MKNYSWDIFISYKSEDVNMVRATAEALMAQGLRVWFAEYYVLLANYDEFQRQIDAGIDDSRYALIFTRDEWANSRYCQIEMTRIMQRIPLDRILRVRQRIRELKNRPNELLEWNAEQMLTRRIMTRTERIQHRKEWMFVKQQGDAEPDMFDICIPQQDWPRQTEIRLDRIPMIDVSEHDDYVGAANAVVEFVARKSDLLSSSARLAETQGKSEINDFVTFNIGYSLDLSGWEVTSKGGVSSQYGNFNGPTFRRQCGSFFIEAHVVLGEGVPSAQPLAHTESAKLDDRQRYRLVREFAKAFEKMCNTSAIENETLGVHILTLGSSSPSEATHGAFTCKLGGRVMPHWQRRYSVVVKHPVSQRDFEFAFTFDFFGDSHQEAAPRQFYRHAHLMDRVVASLRFGRPASSSNAK